MPRYHCRCGDFRGTVDAIDMREAFSLAFPLAAGSGKPLNLFMQVSDVPDDPDPCVMPLAVLADDAGETLACNLALHLRSWFATDDPGPPAAGAAWILGLVPHPGQWGDGVRMGLLRDIQANLNTIRRSLAKAGLDVRPAVERLKGGSALDMAAGLDIDSPDAESGLARIVALSEAALSADAADTDVVFAAWAGRYLISALASGD